MRHSRKIGIDPISFAFVALSLLLAACLLVMDNLNEQALIAWNAFVPAVVLLVGTAVSAWLVRANVIYTLSPIPWFYLTSAAYFGLGPLIFTFGTPEAISNLNYSSHYPIEDQGLFEVNLLSVAGILCVTVGIIIGRRLFPWKHYLREWSVKNFDIPTTERVLWLFLIIGGTVKYVFTLPHILGLTSWVLPGIIQHLSLMLTAAIIIVMLLVQRGMHRYVPVMWILIGSEIATSMITFSKTSVLYTVIAIAIGRYLWAPSFRFLAVSMVLTGMFYSMFLSPFMGHARETIRVHGATDISTLFDGLVGYVDGSTQNVHGSLESNLKQGWWTRLNYSNYQKFAIDRYNTGEPGDSLDQAVYALVPRILYPEKPIMGYGAIFSDLIDPGSSAWVLRGMGMFAEGYWNAGIAGLIGVCLWAGLALVGFTWFTCSWLARGYTEVLFLSFFGIGIGMGPDRWFVPPFVGGIGEAVVYAVGLWAMVHLTQSRIHKSASRHHRPHTRV